MQTPTFNKTAAEATIDASRFRTVEAEKLPKFDRRISVDTYNPSALDADNYEDDLLEKRRQPDCKKPAFEVYCESYGTNNEGEYIRRLEGREIYFFICPLGHKFMLTKKQVLSNVWCTNCTKIFTTIEKHVIDNEGELLSRSLSRSLRLRCKLGHEFELNYKKAAQKWCKDCSKDNKKKLKDMIERENKRIEDEKCKQQVC